MRGSLLVSLREKGEKEIRELMVTCKCDETMEYHDTGADGKAYGYHFVEGAGFIEISVDMKLLRLHSQSIFREEENSL